MIDYQYAFIYKFNGSPNVWGHKFQRYDEWMEFKNAFESLNQYSPDPFGGIEVLFAGRVNDVPEGLAVRAEPFSLH